MSGKSPASAAKSGERTGALVGNSPSGRPRNPPTFPPNGPLGSGRIRPRRSPAARVPTPAVHGYQYHAGPSGPDPQVHQHSPHLNHTRTRTHPRPSGLAAARGIGRSRHALRRSRTTRRRLGRMAAGRRRVIGYGTALRFRCGHHDSRRAWPEFAADFTRRGGFGPVRPAQRPGPSRDRPNGGDDVSRDTGSGGRDLPRT